MNSKSASIPTLAFRVISQPQSIGRGYVSSMFLAPTTWLVNFAHRGIAQRFGGGDWNQVAC